MGHHLNKKSSLTDLERDVMDLWNTTGIPSIIVSQSEKDRCNGAAVFYEGPPFATGMPHYGHALGIMLKDTFTRWHSIHNKHKYTYVRTGWDCHGVPIEYEIQKAHGLKSHGDIAEFGIKNFCDSCSSVVLRCAGAWRDIVARIARWADFDTPYMTMDVDYMNVLWKVFAKLWDKGLVYKGRKVMPFSCALGTAISNFEANSGYKTVEDLALFVKFRIKSNTELKGAFFIAWTTTPWTLPANVALGVGHDIKYVLMANPDGDRFVISEAAKANAHFAEFQEISSVSVDDLVGLEYDPVWHVDDAKNLKDIYKVWACDFVSASSGTGVVHMAGAYGEDDYNASVLHGFPVLEHVEIDGTINATCGDLLKGVYFMDSNTIITDALKEKGLIIAEETISHRYPHCPRSDGRLIYRLCNSWFIKVTALKDMLLKANNEVNWVPSHIKHGRFGNWLEDVSDWCVSRSRYWGTPLPIWESSDGEVLLVRSKEDLERYVGRQVKGLHRSFIDELSIHHEGKDFKRVEFVFDCWYESGSMPFASNSKVLDENLFPEGVFPADFIIEGMDQTRGWFYTLLVIGVALFGRSPYKNVVVNGIVLASDGCKMSKRLKNYPDLVDVIDKYGGDALRWYLVSSPASYGDDLWFSEEGVYSINRDIFIPLLNAVNGIFLGYQESSKEAQNLNRDISYDKLHIMDKWALMEADRVEASVNGFMSEYKSANATRELTQWIHALCNWYVRLSKARLGDNMSTSSLSVLCRLLAKTARMMAPFAPVLSEYIYQHTTEHSDVLKSVHFCNEDIEWLCNPSGFMDASVLKHMETVRDIVALGHSLRKKSEIRVRQPLSKLSVYSSDLDLVSSVYWNEYVELMKAELNVLDIVLSSDLKEGGSFCVLSAKPNYKIAGAKFGKEVQLLATELGGLSQQDLYTLLDGGPVSVNVSSNTIELLPEDVIITQKTAEGVQAVTEKHLTLVLDCELSESLLREGEKRDAISKIMQLRRQRGLFVYDVICVGVYIESGSVSRINDLLSIIKDKCGISDVNIMNSMPNEGVDIIWEDSVFKVVLLT